MIGQRIMVLTYKRVNVGQYKEEFFHIEGGKILNRFLREMVDSLSLETFKVWLGGALRNLI